MSNSGFRIPRNSLAWVMVSLTAVILPHVPRMSAWLIVLCMVCIGVRVLIYQGRISYPGPLLKISLVVLTVLAIAMEFGRNIFSTEAMVSVLVVGISLKLLEMRQKRDVLLVIYLCYFTVVAQFIYSQSIPIAIYMVVCLALITAALISLSQSEHMQDPRRTLGLSVRMLALSVPMMLALFLLFPRMSPLWAVPLQRNAALSGLSENMAPGDIGNLIRSAEVAFRVKFLDPPPPKAELYWRALTLDFFNGRNWSRRSSPMDGAQRLGPQRQSTASWFEAIEVEAPGIRYNIIQEPTGQRWLFNLKMPVLNQDGMLMLRDFQLESIRPVTQRLTYDVTSYLNHRADLRPDQGAMRRALNLPEQGNPLARQFANELWQRTGTPLSYANAVLAIFREQPFFYTLEPGTLGADAIDEFLFTSRAGFCEHYASAFTFLMRAAGVPARVVTGYQGGEFNPYDDTLIVRQYDAHAWSEIWLEGEGWIRMDPTAAVAPHRIDLGSEMAFQNEEGFLENSRFSMLRFRNYPLVNMIRLRLETIDYAWNRWVLNYDAGNQSRLFSRLLGVITPQKLVFVLMGLLALTMSLLAWFLLRQKRPHLHDRAVRLYLRHCDFLARHGCCRLPGEGALSFLERVKKSHPEWADGMEDITRQFITLTYVNNERSSSDSEEGINRLRQSVRRFRLLH